MVNRSTENSSSKELSNWFKKITEGVQPRDRFAEKNPLRDLKREDRTALRKGGKAANNLLRRAAKLNHTSILMAVAQDTTLPVEVRYNAALKCSKQADDQVNNRRAVKRYHRMDVPVTDFEFFLYAGKRGFFNVHTPIIEKLIIEPGTLPSLSEKEYELVEQVILRAKNDNTIHNNDLYRALTQLPKYEGYPVEWLAELIS